MADVVAVGLFTGLCPGRGSLRKGTGMPDTIRKRCGKTHPWRGRFAQSCAVFATLLPHSAAAESGALNPVADYLDAFVSLERNEFAALTLSLGVIVFGVATAITLLRTRARTARE